MLLKIFWCNFSKFGLLPLEVAGLLTTGLETCGCGDDCGLLEEFVLFSWGKTSVLAIGFSKGRALVAPTDAPNVERGFFAETYQ